MYIKYPIKVITRFNSEKNIKGIILYAIFQKKVMEDYYGAFDSYNLIKQHEESYNICKKHFDQAESNYGIDTNAAILLLSGKRQNIGTIIDVNNEIQQILGYSKNELIGTNVSTIMPEIIGSRHNLYLEHYFKKDDQDRKSVV